MTEYDTSGNPIGGNSVQKLIARLQWRWALRPGRAKQFKVGDIYEDCNYHPVLCTENDEGDLWGISLIDGTAPRGCSVYHCAPRKLTVDEAVAIKKDWPKTLDNTPSVW